jgi:DNA-binding MarR family transcriptional regulator
VHSDEDREKLEAEKAQSTVQLLFKAARLLNERAIAETQRRTKLPVRIAHTTLLPHIDLEGTRLTEIASRLGVTKQAAGQLVDELVELGMLERAPDPTDARAKLVRFSRRGRQAIFDGLGVLKEIEHDLVHLLGDANVRTLHEVLAAIVQREGARADRQPRGAPATPKAPAKVRRRRA